jgi:hypothetical protein
MYLLLFWPLANAKVVCMCNYKRQAQQTLCCHSLSIAIKLPVEAPNPLCHAEIPGSFSAGWVSPYAGISQAV